MLVATMSRASLTAICFFLATSDFVLLVAGTRNLAVTTLLTEPFAQHMSLTALPGEVEGYIIDLLADLSGNASIDLTPVTPVADGKYGERVRGEWDGMIRELIDHRAQLAAAPLTKNAARQNAVTFVDPPFMTFDLSILMKRGDRSSQIHNMIDLSNQNEVKYGIVAGGATQSFFRDWDRRPEYNIMWYEMENNPSTGLLESVAEGVRRVRESSDGVPFAFVGEQHMLEFYASREPCELIAIPGNVEEYHGEYHLAVTRDLDSATKTQLARALLNLKNSGRLDALYNKWWTERNQCSQTAPEAPPAAATAEPSDTITDITTSP